MYERKDLFIIFLERSISRLERLIQRDKKLTKEAGLPIPKFEDEPDIMQRIINKWKFIDERLTGRLSTENVNKAYSRILDNEEILNKLKNILFTEQRRVVK